MQVILQAKIIMSLNRMFNNSDKNNRSSVEQEPFHGQLAKTESMKSVCNFISLTAHYFMTNLCQFRISLVHDHFFSLFCSCFSLTFFFSLIIHPNPAFGEGFVLGKRETQRSHCLRTAMRKMSSENGCN